MRQNNQKFKVVSAISKRALDKQYLLEALLLDPSHTSEEHGEYKKRTGMTILRWITIGVYRAYHDAKEAQDELNKGVLEIYPSFLPPARGYTGDSHTAAA